MKKILLPILALGGLLFASSCQMDEPDAGTLTGEVDFSISAGIPGSINTYASNDGGSTNVDKKIYDQRFILEVYDGENYTNLAYREVKTVEVGEKTSFDVRLLAKKYKFALWADFVTNESTEDNLYNTSEGLNAVKIKSNRPAGQEIADAYCYSEEVDLTKGSLSKTFTLERPFGKIRLVSTDKPANDVNNGNEYTPESVTVTYGTDILVPTGYNVLTREASGEIDAGNYTFKPYKEEVTVGGTGKGELYILGIDYILASKSMTNVSFDVQVDDNGARSVTNIPVSANKLTTVIGNFYTNEGNIDVVVDDMFDEDETVYDVPETINVTTSAGIQDAIDAAQDGDIIVIGPGTYGAFDVTKSETQSFFQLPTDKSLTFRGANAGVAGTGSRNEETVITIPFTYAHSTTTTADFTFDGLKFTENGRVSVGKASTGDLTFINNIVKGITINSDPGTTFFTTPYVYDNNSYTMEDIVVENNLVDGTTLSDGTNSCGFRMWGISSATFKNNTFKNFNHSASQFDHVTGDLNFDGNTFEDCNNYKFRVQVINIEGERNYGSNVDDVTEKGFMKIEGTGTCYDTFAEVLAAANANDVIILAEGEYPLDRTITATDNQQYYLPIETAGLTIKAQGSRDKTIVYGREYTDNGAISTQNLITVMASDVTIEGITIMPKVEVNKTIEIRNTGFTLKGCRITPNTYVTENNNGKGGSVYFTYPTYEYSAGTAINGTITDNIIEKATVSFDHIYEGTINVSGNTFDGGNTGSSVITTPIWGNVDLDELKSSKLVVNVSENKFRNIAEYDGSNNPAVRPSYGIINLYNNTFPTDGIYWAATAWDSSNEYGNYCNFGSVFVNYDSPVSQTWTKDSNEPKSFAISNDIIELETTTDKETYGKMVGHGATVPGMTTDADMWEVVSMLTITDERQPVGKRIFVDVEEEGSVVEYVGIQFVRDENGNGKWQYYYANADDGEPWIPFENINTEPGEYEVKITYDNGIITYSIISIEGVSYIKDIPLSTSNTRISAIYLISKVCENSYKTTWSYPIVNF